MSEEDQIYETIAALESRIRGVIIEVCEIMHKAGYESVPVGPMLRMLGVPDDRSEDHDEEYFDISGPEFLAELEEWKQIKALSEVDTSTKQRLH